MGIHESVSTVKEDIVDTAASFDGTWQRRGQCSLNGVVAVISMATGKILDVASFSKYCQGCISMENIKITDPGNYATLFQLGNHTSSAATMEVAG